MALTEQQKESYLKNSNTCPHCGSEDLDASPMQVDCGGTWQEVTCTSCEETWRDVYTLIDVEG